MNLFMLCSAWEAIHIRICIDVFMLLKYIYTAIFIMNNTRLMWNKILIQTTHARACIANLLINISSTAKDPLSPTPPRKDLDH